MHGITVEERPEVPHADGYRAGVGEGGALVLRYRWRSHRSSAAIIVVFAVGWDAAVIAALGSGRFPLFMTFHVVVGLAVSYLALASLVNRTVITATRTRISVRIGPLPIARAVEVDAREVADLEYERVVREARGTTRESHALSAVTKGGARVRLSDAFPGPEVPSYLAERLRAWLDLRGSAGVLPPPGSDTLGS